jgi:hypothetical protein
MGVAFALNTQRFSIDLDPNLSHWDLFGYASCWALKKTLHPGLAMMLKQNWQHT